MQLIFEGVVRSGLIVAKMRSPSANTDKYKPEAAIAAIEVFCHDDECSD
jgi:hypothetical protein